jgi:hypothetical protein
MPAVQIVVIIIIIWGSESVSADGKFMGGGDSGGRGDGSKCVKVKLDSSVNTTVWLFTL